MAIIRKIHGADPGAKLKRRLRYVQTLPTVCTLGNLICGFGAIHLCLRAMWIAGDQAAPTEVIARNSALMERLLPTHVVMAAYLLFLAMIFDALDGRLARWTRQPTDFGAQLDSLADVVSFGVAPPLVMITLLTRQLQGAEPLVVAPFGPSLLGRVAWMFAAIYVACAALRLARFNAENKAVKLAHQSFRGLPSPGAAGALACLVILHDHLYFYDRSVAKGLGQQGGPLSELVLWTLPAAVLALGLLMVSRFPYVHFVNHYLRPRRSFADIVKFLLIVGLAVAYPEIILSLLLVGYAFSGPLVALWRRWHTRTETPREEPFVGNEAGGAVG